MRQSFVVHLLLLLAIVGVMLIVDHTEAARPGGRSGGKRKKALVRRPKGKPQADAPMPTRGADDDYEYDQNYYDDKDDYDAPPSTSNGGQSNDGGGNRAPQQQKLDEHAGNRVGVDVADEDTTEVYFQPDDELPTGGFICCCDQDE